MKELIEKTKAEIKELIEEKKKVLEAVKDKKAAATVFTVTLTHANGEVPLALMPKDTLTTIQKAACSLLGHAKRNLLRSS